MEVKIVGAGSLGLLYAGKLAAARIPVTVATRTEEQAQALRENGITVVRRHDGTGTIQHGTVNAVSVQAETCLDGKGERERGWLLLTVKQRHLTQPLLGYLSRQASAGFRIAALQNGIGHIEQLASVIPQGQLAAAVTTEGAARQGFDRVEHTGSGMTVIGYADGGGEEPSGGGPAETDRPLKVLQKTLEQAGFDTLLSKNINTFIWNKLVINSVINPLTAIHGIPNGQLLDSPFLRMRMKLLFDEAMQVARAEQASPSPDLWDRLIEVCRRTAGNHSSMLQDLQGGRETEVEWINGSLLCKGQSRGLRLPAHEAVYRAIKELERKPGR